MSAPVLLLNKRAPVEIVSAPKLLLADEGHQASDNAQDVLEHLKSDFDLETEDVGMVFFVVPDAAPEPVYQAAVVADASSASVKSSTVRKMTYGVCDLSVTNEDNTLRTVPYMERFLSKDMQLTLSLPSGAHLRQEAVDWLEQADSFAKTVLLAPKHGKLVNFENDPYIQYLPEKGYIGKDRIDLLVEGEDELGRPIAMTIRYYINVLPRKEIDKVIVNEQTYAKAIKKYCGTSKEAWRISYSNPASDAAMGQGGALQSLYTQAATNLLFADLPNGALGQTAGTSITLDDNAAGWGWFNDPTPWGNEEFLPTADPTVWKAKPGSEAEEKMDMLSVLLHEYGHTLGLD